MWLVSLLVYTVTSIEIKGNALKGIYWGINARQPLSENLYVLKYFEVHYEFGMCTGGQQTINYKLPVNDYFKNLTKLTHKSFAIGFSIDHPKGEALNYAFQNLLYSSTASMYSFSCIKYVLFINTKHR